MNEEKTEHVIEQPEVRPERRPEQPPVRQPRTPKPKTMRVDNCARVNVRGEANTDSDPVATLDRGTLVKVDLTFKDEKFAKVHYGEDGNGFIMKQFLAEV